MPELSPDEYNDITSIRVLLQLKLKEHERYRDLIILSPRQVEEILKALEPILR